MHSAERLLHIGLLIGFHGNSHLDIQQYNRIAPQDSEAPDRPNQLVEHLKNAVTEVT